MKDKPVTTEELRDFARRVFGMNLPEHLSLNDFQQLREAYFGRTKMCWVMGRRFGQKHYLDTLATVERALAGKKVVLEAVDENEPLPEHPRTMVEAMLKFGLTHARRFSKLT